jgi:hypothetical protein
LSKKPITVIRVWFCITRMDAMISLKRLSRRAVGRILRGCLLEPHKVQRPSSHNALSRLFPYYRSDIHGRASEKPSACIYAVPVFILDINPTQMYTEVSLKRYFRFVCTIQDKYATDDSESGARLSRTFTLHLRVHTVSSEHLGCYACR